MHRVHQRYVRFAALMARLAMLPTLFVGGTAAAQEAGQAAEPLAPEPAVPAPLPDAQRPACPAPAPPGAPVVEAPNGHQLNVSAGIGLSMSSSSSDHHGSGQGAYARAEYVFFPRWAVTPRLYGGLLLTFPESDSCGVRPCDVESQIVFLGAKGRFMLPIPYVGPFVELGIGVSLGSLRTQDRDYDESQRGAAVHIPFALGVAVGPNHEVDVQFAYLYHPSEHQVGGAFALGFGLPLP